jgi:reactive intermediate/imine deaminase
MGHTVFPLTACLLFLSTLSCDPRAKGPGRGELPDEPAEAPAYLTSTETEALGLPFSEAVRFGGMLYLSGQIGTMPGTLELVPGGIREETRQTLENIRVILERHGSSLGRVVKCTAFLADIGEWAEMNEVYTSFFTGELPARSALAASGLALGARIEMECMAAAGSTGE